MKKIARLSIFFWLFANLCFAQQLPHRTAFANSDFVLNPAMTAPGEFLDWGLNYRRQWLGFEDAPMTGSLFFHFPFVHQNMSVGINISTDKAGPWQRNGLGLAYAYKMRLGIGKNDQLSIGISGKVIQSRFDPFQAVVADTGDQLLNNIDGFTNFATFGAGLFYVSNRKIYSHEGSGLFFGAGSSQLHSLQITGSEDGFPRNLHANAILGARFNSSFSFVEPSVWANYSHEEVLLISANILFELHDAFWTGISYNTDQTVTAQVGVILKNGPLQKGFLRLGGQGTYNIGTIGNSQGLGFEVTLGYRYWL